MLGASTPTPCTKPGSNHQYWLRGCLLSQPPFSPFHLTEAQGLGQHDCQGVKNPQNFPSPEPGQVSPEFHQPSHHIGPTGPNFVSPSIPSLTWGYSQSSHQASEGLEARARLTIAPVLGLWVLVEGQAVAWEPAVLPGKCYLLQGSVSPSV